MLGSNTIIQFLSSDKDSGLGFHADSALSAFIHEYVYILRHVTEMAAFITHDEWNVVYLT